MQIFWKYKASATARTPSCLPIDEGSDIHDDPEGSGPIFGLRPRSHGNPVKSRCMSDDLSWVGKRNETAPKSAALLNCEFWAEKSVASGDLRWSLWASEVSWCSYLAHQPTFPPCSSTVAQGNTIESELDRSDSFMRELVFLSLSYTYRERYMVDLIFCHINRNF